MTKTAATTARRPTAKDLTTEDIDTHGYRLELYRDIDGWAVEVPDLPGAAGAGDTPDEAIALAADAIEGWIEAAKGEGRPVPPPSVADEEYSGRFLLRVPRSLHRRLAQQARREGTSLNSYCTAALAGSVGMAEARISGAVSQWTHLGALPWLEGSISLGKLVVYNTGQTVPAPRPVSDERAPYKFFAQQRG
jgi:antitoxin HicB